MVNLVIVSHSHHLAAGVKELADQMADAVVKVVAVGGIPDDNGDFLLGTDALRITQAIHDCWSEDGVLLLVDLGSAVMSAELALEMLPSEMQAKCLISNAPLVEGAVVAALEASLAHNLATVNGAAEAAAQLCKVEH